MIPHSEWKWFGHVAHLIVGNDCRFHLATQIGEYLVSTVGEYLPDAQVCEIHANVRGIVLEGRGDDRRADFLKKCGYIEIGCNRKYESMVFRAGEPCTDETECGGCGLPAITGHELAMQGYNRAGDAARGHHAMCEKVAADQEWLKEAEREHAQWTQSSVCEGK